MGRAIHFVNGSNRYPNFLGHNQICSRQLPIHHCQFHSLYQCAFLLTSMGTVVAFATSIENCSRHKSWVMAIVAQEWHGRTVLSVYVDSMNLQYAWKYVYKPKTDHSRTRQLSVGQTPHLHFYAVNICVYKLKERTVPNLLYSNKCTDKSFVLYIYTTRL